MKKSISRKGIEAGGTMKGEERRKKIIEYLEQSDAPVSGGKLAKALGVSRQVIVQDIALIRAGGRQVYSLSRGYRIDKSSRKSRVFKVFHTEEEVREELEMIVDLGGYVEDVFVYHKVYGVMRGELNIHSRADIEAYLEKIRTGKSRLLLKTTSGYHYHTVTAESEEILDTIQEHLQKRGFLAQLQDYEPVNFWK